MQVNFPLQLHTNAQFWYNMLSQSIHFIYLQKYFLKEKTKMLVKQ